MTQPHAELIAAMDEAIALMAEERERNNAFWDALEASQQTTIQALKEANQALTGKESDDE